MWKRVLSTCALPAVLGFPSPLPAQAANSHSAGSAVTQQMQAAYAAYQAGHFAEASQQLETLAPRAPKSFDLHELLGLAYAAQAQNGKASQQFQLAVQLQPNSASARNNLATSLVESGRADEAESEWLEALQVQPLDYSVNRNLARLYLKEGKTATAVPLLEAAQHVNPAAADNTYDLAFAYLLVNRLAASRAITEQMLAQSNSGELHTLLGRLDEREGKYVDAANEFSLAAHLDPSEDTLFVWASELMVHRAYEPAIAVFQQATGRYPQSPRLWVGLGMAQYSRGDYEPSVKALLKAADLNAEDARCYLFLSKAFLSSPSQAEAVIERFKRYAALKPEDAMAQYFYAIALWKGRRLDSGAADDRQVESLFLKSIALDPSKAEVHLQLGVLYNDQHDYARALPEFERAAQLDPALADAHFRLGRAYLRTGEKNKSQAELDRFKQLQAQHQAEIDKERAEVQQFIVTGTPAAASLAPLPRP